MKRTHLAIALLVILAGCTTTGQATSEPITIGFAAPLTGNAASYGEASRTGFDLALERINENGGINGTPVRAAYEDTRCKAKHAANAVKKLVEADGARFVLGTVCGNAAQAAAPIAQRNRAVLLSSGASVPGLVENRTYVLRLWPSDKHLGAALADTFIEKDVRTVSLVYRESDYQIGLANAFTKRFAARGGVVLGEHTYPPDERDFRPLLTKVRSEEPDAVLVLTYNEGGLLVKQLRELGIRAQVYGSDTLGTPENLESGGAAMDGVRFLEVAFDKDRSETARFVEAYNRRYGKDSSIWQLSANSYDAAMLTARSLRACGKNTTCVSEQLRNVNGYEGASGTFSIDEDGNVVRRYILREVVNGSAIRIR